MVSAPAWRATPLPDNQKPGVKILVLVDDTTYRFPKHICIAVWKTSISTLKLYM